MQVGAILALTGSIANQGEWVQYGLEVAKNEINANGGNVEIIYEDSSADPKLGVSAYRSIKSKAEIPVVFTMGSSVAIALSPLTNEDAVIQMGLATASPAYSSPDDFTFRLFETAQLETKELAQEIFNSNNTVLALLVINNDYGHGVASAFASDYTQLGGQIIVQEYFDELQTDFKTILAKTTSADAILLIAYTKEGATVLKQAAELGIEKQFYATQALIGGNELFDIAGDAAEGLMVAVPKFDLNSDDPKIRTFREAYQQRYGADPEIYSARAYDAFKIISSALDECGKDTICVKEYLFSMENYQGVSGNISFDQNGDVMRPFEIQLVKDDKFVSYEFIR